MSSGYLPYEPHSSSILGLWSFSEQNHVCFELNKEAAPALSQEYEQEEVVFSIVYKQKKSQDQIRATAPCS